MKIYVLYFFQVPYFWKGGKYFRCAYWLYSEDFCTLSLEISSIPSRRCGQVADNADASQGNRPLTVTPLTKATCVDISDLAVYNQWKWSISHGKISFALSVEKGGAFGVFHQHELKMKINSKNPFSDSQNSFGQNCCQGSPTKRHQFGNHYLPVKKCKEQSFQCHKYGQIANQNLEHVGFMVVHGHQNAANSSSAAICQNVGSVFAVFFLLWALWCLEIKDLYDLQPSWSKISAIWVEHAQIWNRHSWTQT